MEPKHMLLFGLVGVLFIGTGFVQSWNTALTIFNMGLISAIMALGVNMQWGYAGLFNVGVMGFVALGGLAAVLVSMPPVNEAWAAGGLQVLLGLVLGAATIVGAILVWSKMPPGRLRGLAITVILVAGFFIFRAVFDAGVDAVESVDPALTGYLGGLGLPVVLAWPVGGLLAAGAAWIIGKTALGLRSDYLAIATLGIAEIVIAVLKNEDWLARGVKNVTGLPRPVPYEIDLQANENFLALAQNVGSDPVTASTITVKLAYAALFIVVLLALIWLSEKALNSPWGRMMRAIRDNEISASAMGKNVKARHLQIFILGSAVCGLAGAMMTTLDGQLVPGTYQPLRFTFLIWVMVIVGGSGNNWGAVLGGFLIWWLWIQVEPIGLFLMQTITAGMAEDSGLREHLLDSAAHMRLLTMGLILLLVLRFSPRGLIPER
ncbi:branched-chain amino acid ABC transporter permease [Roseobacter sp. HKCCD9010]|uniref:branched-chain amino acid ABC transporter permease n=1 Tax=unclassified Roseobacter TaxID=196798 RepID=UPI0014929D68|nr:MULTISPECIES: branched-chain amino acid ABC transporter permease [unclassified Roseobacter]MBF9050285.1 branched-chain amino acid ABC transporter permease [Rhodobacterales bacterium HKCCD4356]NNV12528.1 branched-chain amino acid ABC transporter permease [Roseobacter sp. HKCCD7357]NNV16007.1 branched-chain amino acid ABC transporter permease [Roseobacter sp. HKCCD8768]NNV25467.1 branched-chain amino acid ABC transporter permease [Roseobacter sp. HKCCD8192]NNV29724.1 branched-chain amino acid